MGSAAVTPDPYAAYGGQATTGGGGADPYASYGGSMQTSAPAPSSTPAPAPEEKPESAYQKYIVDVGGDPVKGAVNFGKGVAHGAMQTASGLLHVGQKIESLNPAEAVLNKIAPVPQTDPSKAADWLDKHSQNSGQDAESQEAQNWGENVESVGEFLLGDEALKGLSAADKLVETGKAVKLLDKYPKLKAMVSTGLRQGAVGAAQGTAKSGGDVVEGAKEGITTGLTGAALEGGGQYVREAQAGRVAREAAPAEAEKGIANVASKAADDATDRFNEASKPKALNDPNAVNRGAVEAKKPGIGTIQTIGQAADHARSLAKPVFQAVDDASDGELTKLQRQRGSAFARRDYAAADEAEQGIDKLLDAHADVASPEQFKAARGAWADAKVLDRIHKGVEGAYNSVPADTAAATGIPRTLKGSAVRTRFGAAIRSAGVDNIDRVLGPEGRDNIFRVAHLLEQTQTAGATKGIIAEMQNQSPIKKTILRVGGAAAGAALGLHGLGHVGADLVVGGLAGETAGAVPQILERIAASPKAGALLDYAVHHGVDPRRAAALIVASLGQNKDLKEIPAQVIPGGDKE